MITHSLPATTRTRWRLRCLLLVCGFAWFVSVVGIFAPWKTAEQLLRGLGAQPIAHDPMVDYWLRMAAGAFTLIGVLFFVFATRPERYACVLPLFAWLMIIEGLILLAHGLRLQLPPFPFYADTAACLLGGTGLLWLARS